MRYILKKRFVLFVLIILLCAAGLSFLVIPIIAHKEIMSGVMEYQPETFVSFDNRFVLKTLKYEEDSGIYASFAIESHDTGVMIFICPYKYRTMDLKSISWEDGSYTVAVKSGDVGTIFFCYVNGVWVKNSKKDIEWSVTKYSDITSRYYEEIKNGYIAAFYEKSEIEIQSIIDWLASCEKSENYYQFIYSDPDSWDMFVYYHPENGFISNNSFRFFIDDSTVNIFVTNEDSVDAVDDYILIRIQAPLRGLWPNSSTLYLDYVSITRVFSFSE